MGKAAGISIDDWLDAPYRLIFPRLCGKWRLRENVVVVDAVFVFVSTSEPLLNSNGDSSLTSYIIVCSKIDYCY